MLSTRGISLFLESRNRALKSESFLDIGDSKIHYLIRSKPFICRISFELQGQQVSIAQYFLKRYCYRLRYPELPCVVERRYSEAKKTIQNNFYPMEVLHVCPGQRVCNKKQTPDMVHF